MTLREKQTLFTELQNDFEWWVMGHDYWQLTRGDAFRDPRVHGEFGVKKGYGRAYSLHKLKLAQDWNLYIWDEKKGRFVYQRSTKAHKPLGLYWEAMHDLCSWGGWFNDGNHYSLAHLGYR